MIQLTNQHYVKPYEHEGFMALSDLLILQACNTNLTTHISSLILASKMGNPFGYFILAKYYQKTKMYKKMKNYLLLNIELFECEESMLEMGLYYDDINNDKRMVEYYDLASSHGNIDATYNLFTYYNKLKDDINMRKYLDRGIDLGDADPFYEYALHYHEKNDYEHMIHYYKCAVEREEELKEIVDHKSLVNDGFAGFNILLLIKYIEKLPQLSKEMEKKLILLKNFPDYLIYKNKINLFSKFNHIAECSICYETKLQIDFKCAHTFCIDCYPHIYMKCCPMCRI